MEADEAELPIQTLVPVQRKQAQLKLTVGPGKQCHNSIQTRSLNTTQISPIPVKIVKKKLLNLFFKKATPSLIQDVDKSIILICLSNDWNRFYNLYLYSSI